jgi:hypothetical protein
VTTRIAQGDPAQIIDSGWRDARDLEPSADDAVLAVDVDGAASHCQPGGLNNLPIRGRESLRECNYATGARLGRPGIASLFWSNGPPGIWDLVPASSGRTRVTYRPRHAKNRRRFPVSTLGDASLLLIMNAGADAGAWALHWDWPLVAMMLGSATAAPFLGVDWEAADRVAGNVTSAIQYLEHLGWLVDHTQPDTGELSSAGGCHASLAALSGRRSRW